MYGKAKVPRYTALAWAKLKRRNGYRLSREDKALLGLTNTPPKRVSTRTRVNQRRSSLVG